MAALLLITVMVMATTSLSYTLWFEEVGIDGTVTTGTLDAAWVNVGTMCAEYRIDPDDPKVGKGPWLQNGEGKDVGSWTIGINDLDDQQLDFTIDGAYPYYTIDCAVKYMNTGTTPWHIQAISVAGTSGNLTNCSSYPASPTDFNNVVLECDQLYVKLIDGITSQIHQYEEVGSNFFVQVKQPAAENSTYTFSAAICVAQWNEDPDPYTCFAAAPPH